MCFYSLYLLVVLLPSSLNALPVAPAGSAFSITVDGQSQSFRQQYGGVQQGKLTINSNNTGLHCGPVAQHYRQTADDWKNANVNDWLDNWWNVHASEITANSNGFAGAFGEWALGNPHWSCQDEGSDSACDFSPCNNPVLNSKGGDTEPAYYVLESINRLNAYFTGIGEAFEVSSIGAALSKDSWATTFYKDKDKKSVTILREVLNAAATTVGLGAAGARMGGKASSVIGSAISALFTGAVGAAVPLLEKQEDKTFKQSADMGGILSKIVINAMKSFTDANNALMQGQNYQGSGDIRSYLKDGMFVDFGGINKNDVTNLISNMLTGQAINQLWRSQKIFILGGGKCGDGEGIGHGPKDYGVCRNGQAWYLYYWQENDVISLTDNKWGWTAVPPGADKLGKGDYAGITVANVIDSSLNSYIAGGYNYDSSLASSRASQALQNGQNPAQLGAAWEGTFTIPVCDVSGTIGKNYQYSGSIILPHGRGNRPVWCGPVCSQDLEKTKAFINAAKMNNFQSPKHLCKKKPGY